MAKSAVILKKAEENIPIQRKYQILHDYIYGNLSNKGIADKYGITPKTTQETICALWKDFSQVKETKALIGIPSNVNSTVTINLDPSKINEAFLSQLSEPDSPILTDPELIYCELYNTNGDEFLALRESGLAKGLKKPAGAGDLRPYEQALSLRSFYLRRKPNIVAYLKDIQQKKISAITDGKAFIQIELLKVIEKLNNSEGDKNLMARLKAIELAARTFGALEDKLTVEEINGDSALDKILKRAKVAKETTSLIEQ